ncbi:MAG: type II toxin-antitoxin system prevent-host-death family antitoxin [Elusimicrobia bacterium]|nr:type II toxin-antitoxin system prevent-host-death family antitoxin [Elusimicrobiota bacterium]
MANETSYTHARAHFASLCSDVTATREAVIIHRRRAEDVALVSAEEWRSLLETAHLLRSPKNARRLLRALLRAQKGRSKATSPAALRREVGLDRKA